MFGHHEYDHEPVINQSTLSALKFSWSHFSVFSVYFSNLDSTQDKRVCYQTLSPLSCVKFRHVALWNITTRGQSLASFGYITTEWMSCNITAAQRTRICNIKGEGSAAYMESLMCRKWWCIYDETVPNPFLACASAYNGTALRVLHWKGIEGTALCFLHV